MPRLLTTVCSLVLVAAGPARAAGPFDDLLKHAPAHTNAVVLIDVKGAFASPLAKKEKWAEKGQPENRGGLGFVPSDGEIAVIAADINLNAMVREFQAGFVKVKDLPNMRDLAAREGGAADEIAGQLAVLSPRDVYYAALPNSTLLAVHPADRQATARYLKAVLAGKTGELSPYLKRAAAGAAGNTVTIALDLEDVADRNLLKAALPASPSVAKNKAVDVGVLAAFLAQVKGLTFSATVGETITARVAVEFALEPARFRNTLPELFREVLDGEGVAIDGFENWKVEFADNTMTFSGSLETADLKRVLSLFAFPNPAGEAEPAAKAAGPTAGATRRYLAAVDVILADISRTKESSNYEKMATWHDKAADQIRHLSQRNVDPAAVEAAHQAAKRLRAVGQSLRGVPIDTKALESQQYFYGSGGNSVGYWPTWWGMRAHVIANPVYVDTNIPKIRAEIAKVTADDKKRRFETWGQINQIMADTKTALSRKYKTPF